MSPAPRPFIRSTLTTTKRVSSCICRVEGTSYVGWVVALDGEQPDDASRTSLRKLRAAAGEVVARREEDVVEAAAGPRRLAARGLTLALPVAGPVRDSASALPQVVPEVGALLRRLAAATT